MYTTFCSFYLQRNAFKVLICRVQPRFCPGHGWHRKPVQRSMFGSLPEHGKLLLLSFSFLKWSLWWCSAELERRQMPWFHFWHVSKHSKGSRVHSAAVGHVEIAPIPTETLKMRLTPPCVSCRFLDSNQRLWWKLLHFSFPVTAVALDFYIFFIFL